MRRQSPASGPGYARRAGARALAGTALASCLVLSPGCSEKGPSGPGGAPAAAGSTAGRGADLPPLDPETFPHAEK